MPIQFPPSPSVNQEYTYEGKVWAWDGSSWVGVRQATGIQKSNIWAKQNLLIPKRGFGLNSGYNGTTDQRRTAAGTIPMLKHNIERDLGEFLSVLVGTPWTPANITTSLWLDAGDASTITLNSTTVSQWNDKSGNSRNATQGSSVQQPTYTSNSQNGYGIISFDGSNDNLDISSTTVITSGNANFGVFAAYKPKSTTYGTILANYSAGNFQLLFGSQTIAPYLAPWGLYNNASLDLDSDNYTQNANLFISCVRTGGSVVGYTNGTTKNTVANSASVYTGANTASVWTLGANTDNSEVANMDLYELIVINGTVSTDTRQRTEGYLAWKWGLQANLPNDHPYKNIAPTI